MLVGQTLVHLRDGVSAIAQAARVCDETLVVVEGSFDTDDPVGRLVGNADVPYAWYQYSTGWHRKVLGLLGFDDVTVTVAGYPCEAPLHADSIDLTTFVAHRTRR